MSAAGVVELRFSSDLAASSERRCVRVVEHCHRRLRQWFGEVPGSRQ